MRRFLVFLLVIFVASCFACTGFVVDSNIMVRGMNFDYTPGTKIFLSSFQEGDIKILMLSFDAGGMLVSTLGVNSFGNFATLQMTEQGWQTISLEDTIFVHEILNVVLESKNVAFLDEFLSVKRVINTPGFYLHTLAADKFGNAMIVEPGTRKNMITRKEDEVLVMTNFPVYKFNHDEYLSVTGPGSDRYKIAWETILEGLYDFDMEKAFSALEKTSWPYTLFSMVFFPETLEVYFCLNHDFERIFTFSFSDSTIKAFEGFQSEYEVTVSCIVFPLEELDNWK